MKVNGANWIVVSKLDYPHKKKKVMLTTHMWALMKCYPCTLSKRIMETQLSSGDNKSVIAGKI